MQQVVYGDLFFLINFSMDFLCLFLVAKLLSRPMSTLRFTLASAVGGIYSVVSLFLPGGIFAVLLDLLCCIVICLLAFAARGESRRSLITLTAAYFLSSVLLGGIMTGIFSILNRLSPPLSDLEESADIPPWILLLVGIFSGLTALFGGKFLHKKAQIKTFRLEVQLGGRKATCLAFCDSGNLLCDPLDGKHVILLDNALAPLLLPANLKKQVLFADTNVDSIPPSLKSRLRIIPLHTANAESILFALKPDKIILKTQKEAHKVDALIGFTELGGALHDCKALIPPELVV